MPAQFGAVALLVILVTGLARHAPAYSEPPATLTLKPVVQVASDDVTLLDIVAAGDVQSAGAIVICHSPNAGSLRTISREDVAAVLKKSDAVYLLRGPEQISVMRAARQVTSADLKPLISAALAKQSPNAVVEDVHLQAAIYVTDLSALKLRKLRFDPAVQKYRAWFVSSDLPHAVRFEAMATLAQGTVPQTLNAVTADHSPAGLQALVRRGDNAAMHLAGQGFSASLAVVCLENGYLTNVIRVRETETKRVYRAEVIDRGILRAVARED